MISTAWVNIWNKRVGAVAWLEKSGVPAFEFDPSFLQQGLDLSPLKMPLSIARNSVFRFSELGESNTFRGLPGLLADALPDRYGNTLINTWLARRGRPADSMNPVEMLCFIGNRGMGALEFEPATPKDSGEVTILEIDSLVDIARQILSKKKSFHANLDSGREKALLDVLKIGTSAGGARAKAVIAYHPQTGEVRSGQADAPKGYQHWLIKLDGADESQFGSSSGYGRVEMAYHLMAVDCGIEMMECRLLEENGRAHFMTRRFDRTGSSGKLHVQTLCGLAHYDFRDIHSYSYEQVFQVMRMLHLPYPQAEQLFRRMVFNVVARNCDDHTKNFAFMMNKDGEWRLSPAYDVCHAYRPGSTWVSRHALSINGKREKIKKADLIQVGGQMNIKKAADMIDEIKETVKHWETYASKVDVSKKLVKAIRESFVKI
jgi:serine/threonine-protein kinase HipA